MLKIKQIAVSGDHCDYVYALTDEGEIYRMPVTSFSAQAKWIKLPSLIEQIEKERELGTSKSSHH